MSRCRPACPSRRAWVTSAPPAHARSPDPGCVGAAEPLRARAARPARGSASPPTGPPCPWLAPMPQPHRRSSDRRSEERRVGKRVDLGGRPIIKKKKKERKETTTETDSQQPEQQD